MSSPDGALEPLPSQYETLAGAGVDSEGIQLSDLVGEVIWVYALETYKAFDKPGVRIYCKVQSGEGLLPAMRQARTQAPQPLRVLTILLGAQERVKFPKEKPWRLEVVKDGQTVLLK